MAWRTDPDGALIADLTSDSTTGPLIAGSAPDGRIRGTVKERYFFRRAAGNGWALVGDAGYFKDPLTAHGITDALRDAELLARAIVQGTTSAFADYETRRHALSRRLFEITDDIASFAWTDGEVQSLHRAFSTEMSREVRALAALEPLEYQLPSASTPHVA